jgi:hypothetical protein
MPRRREIKAVARSGAHRRSLLGELGSERRKSGAEIRTTAFPESVRARARGPSVM